MAGWRFKQLANQRNEFFLAEALERPRRWGDALFGEGLAQLRFFQLAAKGIWPEHQDWIPIRNGREAMQLLEHGSIEGLQETLKIMFSSRMGLEFLIQNHWAE